MMFSAGPETVVEVVQPHTPRSSCGMLIIREMSGAASTAHGFSIVRYVTNTLFQKSKYQMIFYIQPSRFKLYLNFSSFNY